MFQIKENYLINIISKQKIEDDDHEITIRTVGDFNEIGDKKYIVYKEYEEESSEKYKLNIIKFEKPGLITLTKSGETPSRLILEKGIRHQSPYYTKFGVLMMGIFTNSVDFYFYENEWELKIKYSIDINSSFVSANEVTVKVKKIDKQNKGEADV